MVLRKARLALFACAAGLAAGCSAGSTGRMIARNPPPPPPRPTVAAEQVLARTNANAERVEALRAKTAVSGNFGRVLGAMDGYLALERPSNFNMKLKRAGGSPVVDVGSNDQQFWVWTKEAEEKAVFVGDYDARGFANAELPFQPEWIVEAMGLRGVSPDEMARIQVAPGKAANTLVLTHERQDGRGATVRKQTVVDATTYRVIRHVFLAPDGRTPLAWVDPRDYQSFGAPGPDGSGQVELPQTIHVKLLTSAKARENPDFEIRISRVELNPDFTEQARQAYFEIPRYDGYPLRRLDSGPTYAAGERPREYKSRPAPPSGVELGEPEPIGIDGASLQRRDPMPYSADLPPGPSDPRGADAIVRTGLPRLPGEAEAPPTRSVSTSDAPRVLGQGFQR